MNLHSYVLTQADLFHDESAFSFSPALLQSRIRKTSAALLFSDCAHFSLQYKISLYFSTVFVYNILVFLFFDRGESVLPPKKLTRGDVILIFTLLASAVLSAALLYSPDRGASFTVNADGECRTCSLSSDTSFSLSSRGIDYVVTVDGGSVEVSEAGCPDGLCVSRGKISRAGESIVCVPGRLVITIGESSGGADVVVG